MGQVEHALLWKTALKVEQRLNLTLAMVRPLTIYHVDQYKGHPGFIDSCPSAEIRPGKPCKIRSTRIVSFSLFSLDLTFCGP